MPYGVKQDLTIQVWTNKWQLTAAKMITMIFKWKTPQPWIKILKPINQAYRLECQMLEVFPKLWCFNYNPVRKLKYSTVKLQINKFKLIWLWKEKLLYIFKNFIYFYLFLLYLKFLLFFFILIGSTSLSLQGDNLDREIGDQGDSPRFEPLSRCLDILCNNRL